MNGLQKKLSARMVQKRTGNEVLCGFKTSISELQVVQEQHDAAGRRDVAGQQRYPGVSLGVMADESETNLDGDSARGRPPRLRTKYLVAKMGASKTVT